MQGGGKSDCHDRRMKNCPSLGEFRVVQKRDESEEVSLKVPGKETGSGPTPQLGGWERLAEDKSLRGRGSERP